MSDTTTEQVSRVLNESIAKLDAIPDPLERAQAIQAIYRTMADASVKIGTKYSEAVLAAKSMDGMSLRRLAQELNISQHRLHLLLNKARNGGNGSAIPAPTGTQ